LNGGFDLLLASFPFLLLQTAEHNVAVCCAIAGSDRPKTDFLVSAENEYSAQGRKHQKNVNLYMENNFCS
jgi:hypothetical protein